MPALLLTLSMQCVVEHMEKTLKASKGSAFGSKAWASVQVGATRLAGSQWLGCWAYGAVLGGRPASNAPPYLPQMPTSAANHMPTASCCGLTPKAPICCCPCR